MENKRRNRRKTSKNKSGIHNLIVTGSDPTDIDGQEWYLDSPDVRLTKVFSVVLVLHIIAIGGILAFKMLDSRTTDSTMAQASSRPNESAATQRVLAGRVDIEPIPVALNSVVEPSSQYKVIAGDTLSGIAEKLGVGMRALQIENNISSADSIFEGMILEIPKTLDYRPVAVADRGQLPDHPTQVVLKSDYMKETIESGEVYEVRSGDTAWAIASQFNVDYKQLLRLNGIDRADKLQVGRILSIPTRR